MLGRATYQLSGLWIVCLYFHVCICCIFYIGKVYLPTYAYYFDILITNIFDMIVNTQYSGTIPKYRLVLMT